MTIANMHMQAEKLSRYANWAHMKVNTTKTVVTGILHSNAHTGMLGHRHTVDHAMMAARLQDKIYVQGKPVQFIQPDQPFKYLGVLLTLTLDWRHQFQAVQTAVRKKCGDLKNRGLPAALQMRIIRTVIKPMITYSFSTAPYTPAQLKVLDAQLARAAKAAYKQRTSMSTALALEDTDKFGLGLTSLLVDYAHACVRNLVDAANDASPYGIISRSLLSFQAARTGGLNETQLHGVANAFMRVRQLSAAHQSGLRIANQATMQEMALDGTDVVRLVTGLAAQADTVMGLPPHVPCRLVQPLTALGVHRAEDLLTRDYTRVLSAQDLRLKYGKRVTAAHVQALYRLMYVLHTKDTPHMPLVKRMRLTADDVSSKNMCLVHPVHRAALEQASQRAVDQQFRNILRPMPRMAPSENIKRYFPLATRDTTQCRTPCHDTQG